MSSFALKLIAIITMFIDHLGYAINNGHFSNYNYIGRIAFPIFAFQISEGYIHTNNLKNYLFKLSIFALISQLPYMLFSSFITNEIRLNVFFTLFLGLLSIYIFDKCKYKILGIIAAIFIGFVANLINCDYGFYGIAIILIFYIFKNNFINASLFFLIATAIRFIIPIIKNGYHNAYVYLFLCTSISLLFLFYYNGKEGKKTKYLFYFFYPIHLLLIYSGYLILNL